MTSILKDLLLSENKKDEARRMIKPMIIRGTYNQEDIEKRMIQRLGIKPATADTYYHMIVKELNLEDRSVEDEDELPEEDDESGFDEGEPDSEMLPDLEFDDDGVMVGDAELEDNEYAIQDNPERRGIVRRVDNAHLVYKRMNDSGTFDELWIFNTSDNMSDSLEIKRAILAATDIPPRQTTSEDGIQRYTMTTMGDVQFMEINNLPQ